MIHTECVLVLLFLLFGVEDSPLIDVLLTTEEDIFLFVRVRVFSYRLW